MKFDAIKTFNGNLLAKFWKLKVSWNITYRPKEQRSLCSQQKI
jgi:hypothetical protein